MGVVSLFGSVRRMQEEAGDFVYLVGRIPLGSIHHVDWSSDPTNWRPRLYVDYGWSGPFTEVALYEDRGGYLVEQTDVTWKRPRRNYVCEVWDELRRRREARAV
jgi:hypothetical protein